ncbi:MAG: choice-of-anchor tandem repeat GloVer-containing protein [Terriglobales bacterium]
MVVGLRELGNLFGTAAGGSANGCCGVVFALVPHSGGNWTESVFRFTSENGGAGTGPLVFDARGNLYGTSPLSGRFKSGTAYRLKQGAKGAVTDASYSFCLQTGCPNGSAPYGGLVLDGSGNPYGTTFEGGLGYGVGYEITP